jgi:hypothetical protein
MTHPRDLFIQALMDYGPISNQVDGTSQRHRNVPLVTALEDSKPTEERSDEERSTTHRRAWTAPWL